MRIIKSPFLVTVVLIAGLLIGLGVWSEQVAPAVAGVLGAMFALLRVGRSCRQRPNRKATAQGSATGAGQGSAGDTVVEPIENRTEDLVGQSLQDERYAVLLQRPVIDSLTEEQRKQAIDDFEEGMALVPQGRVLLDDALAVVGYIDEDVETHAERSMEPFHVGAFYFDRFAVTNRQFQRFVDVGGYEQMEYWLPEIWPEVLDFTDETGQPGPRFWRDGKHADGQADHPVVGVCWYEAAAYASWAGKRLPSDAEWVKAAAWPVQVGADQVIQRRYPWGEVLDRGQANLWCSGLGATVSVEEFAEGISVGGVHQLVGNAWEWTADDVGERVESAMIAGGDLILQSPMKSVRGGAFDTYFEAQATCDFRSAERLVARKHNIGFRCAVDARELIVLTESADGTLSADLPIGSGTRQPTEDPQEDGNS